MKTGTRMTRISIQLPQELLEDAKILAKSNAMSISSLFRFILVKEIQNLSTQRIE